jgi:hypothetical protein
MRRWFARLAFSFILLAVVFAWEGYRIRRGDFGPGKEWKMYVFFATAAVCFGLGLRGMHERHRQFNDVGREDRAGEDPPDEKE